MIAVLSPAKTFATLDTASVVRTQPYFAEQAATIARAATKLKPAKLQKLMNISPQLASVNVERYAGFEAQPDGAAIGFFDGDVYRGFDAPSLDEAALAYASDHVRILSGLYGLLRPTDAIRPYRMEMHTPWAPRGGDLYGFWRKSVAERLTAELADEGSGLILNLASKEYWRVVEPHLHAPRSGVRVVDVDFRDRGPNGLRFNTFVAKKARGAMARFLCETRATDLRTLEAFDYQDYAYDAASSDEATMRFVRPMATSR